MESRNQLWLIDRIRVRLMLKWPCFFTAITDLKSWVRASSNCHFLEMSKTRLEFHLTAIS